MHAYIAKGVKSLFTEKDVCCDPREIAFGNTIKT